MKNLFKAYLKLLTISRTEVDDSDKDKLLPKAMVFKYSALGQKQTELYHEMKTNSEEMTNYYGYSHQGSGHHR